MSTESDHVKYKQKIRLWIKNHPKINPKNLSKPGFYRFLTNPIRVLPDFIIIGAARSGTSTMYDYLVRNPLVISALTKEIKFFDGYYNFGLAWYRSFFPTILEKIQLRLKNKQNIITGEATPDYIFHPIAPKRIGKIIPQVKLIALLRNPVDRAYSHYSMFYKTKLETLSFEKAIQHEEKRIAGEKEKILEDENYYSPNFTNYSYLYRGIYVEQLKLWYDIFSKEQILIIRSEDLYSQPEKIKKQVCEFLSIPYIPIPLRTVKELKYSKMNPVTRECLINFFKPYNERLYKFLGQNFNWDK
jgi:Sulfotransferase domain